MLFRQLYGGLLSLPSLRQDLCHVGQGCDSPVRRPFLVVRTHDVEGRGRLCFLFKIGQDLVGGRR